MFQVVFRAHKTQTVQEALENKPYSRADLALRELRDHAPRVALRLGALPLHLHRRATKGGKQPIRPGGSAVFCGDRGRFGRCYTAF